MFLLEIVEKDRCPSQRRCKVGNLKASNFPVSWRSMRADSNARNKGKLVYQETESPYMLRHRVSRDIIMTPVQVPTVIDATLVPAALIWIL